MFLDFKTDTGKCTEWPYRNSIVTTKEIQVAMSKCHSPLAPWMLVCSLRTAPANKTMSRASAY